MPNSFIDFYVKGWYVAFQAGSTWQVYKNFKKTLQSVIEFVSLFLGTHVPPLPSEMVNGISHEALQHETIV